MTRSPHRSSRARTSAAGTFDVCVDLQDLDGADGRVDLKAGDDDDGAAPPTRMEFSIENKIIPKQIVDRE